MSYSEQQLAPIKPMRWTKEIQARICIECTLSYCQGFERSCCPLRQAYAAYQRHKHAQSRRVIKWIALSGVPLAAYGLEG
jgi:hypothetical protein